MPDRFQSLAKLFDGTTTDCLFHAAKGIFTDPAQKGKWIFRFTYRSKKSARIECFKILNDAIDAEVGKSAIAQKKLINAKDVCTSDWLANNSIWFTLETDRDQCVLIDSLTSYTEEYCPDAWVYHTHPHFAQELEEGIDLLGLP